MNGTQIVFALSTEGQPYSIFPFETFISITKKRMNGVLGELVLIVKTKAGTLAVRGTEDQTENRS